MILNGCVSLLSLLRVYESSVSMKMNTYEKCLDNISIESHDNNYKQ